ncbi:MAG: winged helix-turn-helix domain-containing protein [archaeon]|jgi:DNA-binding transcriptional ArsR family regulator
MDSRIILDEKSFKALSADSRVSILKNLGERRKTLTELSQKLNLGSSTVKEHCDILVNAELIKQIDEGRKWKYYELTSKGKQITQPNLFDEVKVLIVLCLSTLVVGGFVFFILMNLTVMQSSADQSMRANDYSAGEQLLKTTMAAGSEIAPVAQIPQAPIVQGISFEIFAISVIVALICGIILGWYFTRKR